MAEILTLGAFHGKPELKADFLARLDASLARRGPALDVWGELQRLGIPEWLSDVGRQCAALASPGWSRDFAQGVRVGAQLDAIAAPFLVFVLRAALEKVLPRYTDVRAVCYRAIAIWEKPDAPGRPTELDAICAAAIKAASNADARPPWNAARTAEEATKAVSGKHGVAAAMDAAVKATTSASYSSNSDGFPNELLRLVKGLDDGNA